MGYILFNQFKYLSRACIVSSVHKSYCEVKHTHIILGVQIVLFFLFFLYKQISILYLTISMNSYVPTTGFIFNFR